ncbi:putative transposase [Candidatus Erwinia dacicola]|uniref:Transposase n=1 Tax=Candidatus Erwinia dacicola TaxID=252393 RepID=A0A328TK77_9GAMM|nr:putative transposase [Candidatus Erwinia dacicola]
MWSQLQQASLGRLVSITLKALLMSATVRVSRGSEAGKGLRAED